MRASYVSTEEFCAVLILLPPSEGKTSASRRRRPVDLAALSWPELPTPAAPSADALAEVSAREDALTVLGVGASLDQEVRDNIDIWAQPAAPAGEIYSGVLYDALDAASLDAPARRRANRSILVISALWGAVRLSDRIPAYRLSMTVDLPGLGPLAPFWRPHLSHALEPLSARGVIIDCRSAPYQQAWPTPAPERTAQVRILSKDSRTAVSHMAKHTRGLVARHLCSRSEPAPKNPEQLAAAVGEAFEVGLSQPRSTRSSWVLDVVEP